MTQGLKILVSWN